MDDIFGHRLLQQQEKLGDYKYITLYADEMCKHTKTNSGASYKLVNHYLFEECFCCNAVDIIVMIC